MSSGCPTDHASRLSSVCNSAHSNFEGLDHLKLRGFFFKLWLTVENWPFSWRLSTCFCSLVFVYWGLASSTMLIWVFDTPGPMKVTKHNSIHSLLSLSLSLPLSFPLSLSHSLSVCLSISLFLSLSLSLFLYFSSSTPSVQHTLDTYRAQHKLTYTSRASEHQFLFAWLEAVMSFSFQFLFFCCP